MIACPSCGGATRSLETRQTPSGARRRRVCVKCDKRVTTLESIVVGGRGRALRDACVLMRLTDVERMRRLLDDAVREDGAA